MGKAYQLEVPARHPLAFQKSVYDVCGQEKSLRHQLHDKRSSWP